MYDSIFEEIFPSEKTGEKKRILSTEKIFSFPQTQILFLFCPISSLLVGNSCVHLFDRLSRELAHWITTLNTFQPIPHTRHIFQTYRRNSLNIQEKYLRHTREIFETYVQEKHCRKQRQSRELALWITTFTLLNTFQPIPHIREIFETFQPIPHINELNPS